MTGIEAQSETHPISPREMEVLILLAKGLRHKEIAQELGISEATAYKHTSNLHKRHGVHNSASLLIQSINAGRLKLTDFVPEDYPFPGFAELSTSERDVLVLLATSPSVNEIASVRVTTPSATEGHLRNIRSKIGPASLPRLIVLSLAAQERGILSNEVSERRRGFASIPSST